MIVVQRTSGDMRLNPHLHVVFLDGAYHEGARSASRARHGAASRLTIERGFGEIVQSSPQEPSCATVFQSSPR
ncbi:MULTISPECIES: hypothetical protein [Sorangium]|uniref:hypothetical protein n=1 Tax=Sorangium TaxID=39643 RepID=UPI003D9C2568